VINDMSDRDGLPAGDFSVWVTQMQDALRGDRESDVPCGGCTACCTSSQFIHIGPDEVETIARIPIELLFQAPRSPPGHVLMGYDERGHCPMLVDAKCTIYEHRPRTCRTYDCRVFPAAGVEPDDDGKIDIATRARRWTFSYPTDEDRRRHDAVQIAAVRLREDRTARPDGLDPTNATQLAVAAVALHEAFMSSPPD
jgi:uncharacterized protein